MKKLILIYLLFVSVVVKANYVDYMYSICPQLSALRLVGTTVPHPDLTYEISFESGPDVFNRGTGVNIYCIYKYSNGAIGPCGLGRKTSCFVPNLHPMDTESLKSIAENFSKKRVCGSVIDYVKKTVAEQIPVDGAEFYLNYSSEYNAKRLRNRTISIGKDFIESLDKFEQISIVNKADGSSVNTIVDQTKESLATLSWDGVSNNSSDNIFVSKMDYTVSFNHNLGVDTNTPSFEEAAAGYLGLTIEEFHLKYPVMPFVFFGTYIPVATYDESLTVYHPEVWGLKGWTVSIHHYFDVQKKILYSGSGSIEKYSNYKSTQLPDYDSQNLIIIPDKADATQYFVFKSNGQHLETRSLLSSKPIYKFSYDAANKLTTIENKVGKIHEFIYDSNRQIIKIIAPYGQQTNITANDQQILSVTNSLGQNYEMTYDDLNLLTSFKSVTGVVTNFIYNANGDIIEERKNNGLVQSFITELTKTYKVLVNWGVKRAITITKEPQKETVLFKNSSGQLISTNITDTNNSRETDLILQNDDRSSFNKMPHPFWGDSQQTISKINNTLAGISSTEEVVENYSFLTSATYTDSQNPLSITSLRSDSSRPNMSNQDFIIFDIVNKVIQYKSPLYSSFSNSYLNTLGQVIRLESPDDFPIDFFYNSNDRLEKIQKASFYELYSYDQYGYLSSIVNSKNQVTSFTRDTQGKVLTKILPNLEQVRFEYTNGGELKKIITPSKQVHNFIMSLGDYISQYTEPGNGITQYNYDSDKRLVNVTKPSGKTIDYQYSSTDNRLDSLVISNGQYQFTNYDPQSRPHTLISADNIKTDLAWIGNQVQQQIWYDTDGSQLARIAYKFNPNQLRINQIILNDTTISNISYRPTDGRVLGINSATYDYNIQSSANELLNKINISFGAINLTYDNKKTDGGNSPSQHITFNARDKSNNPVSIALKRAFDGFGQASEYSTSVTNGNTGTQSAYYQLTPHYDANNRITQVQKIRKNYVNNQEITNSDFYNNYSYPVESNNNLKEFVNSPTATGTQKRTIATHSADDKLLTLRGAIHRDYTYTEDGDLESITNCYGTTNYEYDVFSNLKKVTLTDGRIIEYKVDGMNRRVKKLINGVTKEYYIWYDQIHIAAILDENKQPKLTYIYGPESNSPSYVTKDGVTYRIIHDPGLGSIRYVVDPTTQKIAQEIEYDEYGNVMKNTNPDFQPLTYAGGLYDADTKLIRFGARDYDPTIGRWTTKDPSGFNGGTTNLYEYGFSNPMSYIDPDGLSPRDVANIKNAFNTIVNQMIKNGQRRDGSGYLNGQLNNAESLLAGLSYMTSGKMVGRLFEGCEGQSSITQNQLQSLKTDDQWTFQLIFNRSPLHPMGHFRIQGTSSNPSDPKLILDPWAFEFSQ